MHGGVAAGYGNPTSSLVPRVSMGHKFTSCKHAPEATTVWGCVGRGGVVDVGYDS